MATDHARLLRALQRDARFEVVKSRRTGHWKIKKDGRIVEILPCTPGGGRGWQNALARLKRHGFEMKG